MVDGPHDSLIVLKMLRSRNFTLFVSLGLALFVPGCAEPPPPPPAVVVPTCDSLTTLELLRAPHCKVGMVAAHRGDRESGPENSVTSVVGAARNRIRLVELDLRRSSDGVFFLFHDKTFSPRNVCSEQRGQWGRFPDALTQSELSLLRLPPDCTEPIPTLEQVFSSIKDLDLAVQLDLKGNSVQALPDLMALATKEGVMHKLIIQLEHPDLIKAIRDVYPDVGILARCFDEEQVKVVLPFHPEIIQVDADMVNENLVRSVHEANGRVLVKAVGEIDEPVRWSNLLSQGVSIVLTDRAREMSAMLSAIVDSIPPVTLAVTETSLKSTNVTQ